MSHEPGQMIAHYRVIEKLGAGGMGVVYKGLDTKLNRYVALKVLPAHLTADVQRRPRFQREAQAMAALQHPNIAVVYEVGEHNDSPFIAMEYVDGKTLRQRLERGALPLREWLRVARRIAEGVAHAHSHGVVHRDLKPDNVLLTADGQVKILDFGLAKLLDLQILPEGADTEVHTRLDTMSGELTRAGQVFGTAAYMSPEQARGEAVDHRSDIFSLGVVLYECASGKRPFSGETHVETLHGVLHEEPLPLSTVALEVPVEAERVVRKALEKEPENRYQHAEELAVDLRTLQRDLDSGRTTAPQSIGTKRMPRAAAGSARRRWLVPVALVTVVLVAAAVWWERRSSAPASSTPAISSAAVIPEGAPIAVIGFENLNDPQDHEQLGRMLMGLVTTDLAESGGLTVVSMPKVLSAMRQVTSTDAAFSAAHAADTARRAGAQLMLVGQVGRVGDRLLLTSELVDVESGQTLSSHQKTATSMDELFDVAGEIGNAVRDRLGHAQAPHAEAFDLAGALTSSPEAYRKFAAGEIALHEMQFSDAIDQFAQAIRADSTFALAYYKRAIADNWAGREEEASVSLREGLRYIDRLPARWKVVFETYLHYSAGEIEQAYNKLVPFLENEPDIPDAYYTLGEILTHESRYRDDHRARQLFEKSLAIDPTFKVVFFHLFDGYLAADDLERAQSLLQRYKAENPQDSAVREVEATLLVAEGKLEEAMALCEQELMRGRDHIALRLSYVYCVAGQLDKAYENANNDLLRVLQLNPEGGGEQGLRRATRGNMQLARGRFLKGMEDLHIGAAHMASGRLEAIAARSHVVRAEVHWLLGDHAAALGDIRDAIAADSLYFGQYYWWVRILATSGQVSQATQVFDRYRQVCAGVASPEAAVWEDLIRIELALARGELGQARQRLRTVGEAPRENVPLDVAWELQGRVEEAAGDPRLAIESYARILERARRRLFVQPVTVIRTLFEVAKLEEQRGDIERAREHYEAHLRHWGEADVSIPSVQEARARLVALQKAGS